MPTYQLPTVNYRNPEAFIHSLHQHLEITSLLDVGAGHGGVLDYGFWTSKQDKTRLAACDIHWIREMAPMWEIKIRVNVMELTKHYKLREFDLVGCYEVLEHVENPELALEELVKVANKMVIITSGDEMSHQGAEQAAIELVNPHQRYLRQPKVEALLDLGFKVCVDEDTRRRLIAWKYV